MYCSTKPFRYKQERSRVPNVRLPSGLHLISLVGRTKRHIIIRKSTKQKSSRLISLITEKQGLALLRAYSLIHVLSFLPKCLIRGDYFPNLHFEKKIVLSEIYNPSKQSSIQIKPNSQNSKNSQESDEGLKIPREKRINYENPNLKEIKRRNNPTTDTNENGKRNTD